MGIIHNSRFTIYTNICVPPSIIHHHGQTICMLAQALVNGGICAWGVCILPSLLMLYCTCYLMHIQDQTSVKYIISIYSMSVRSIFAPCSSLFSSTVHYIVLLQYISVQSDCEQSYQWTDRLDIFGHLFGYLDIQVHQWLANCDKGWSKSSQDTFNKFIVAI